MTDPYSMPKLPDNEDVRRERFYDILSEQGYDETEINLIYSESDIDDSE